MTEKDIYCCGRAEYLNEHSGMSIKEGYAIAEKEWDTQHRPSQYPRACEALGYCPYNNKVEGFPCEGCPYEKQGGYSE